MITFADQVKFVFAVAVKVALVTSLRRGHPSDFSELAIRALLVAAGSVMVLFFYLLLWKNPK
jgi:hypothetical protein